MRVIGIAGVIAATLAAGGLAAPPSATAHPPVPLAPPPACQEWKLFGDKLNLTLNDGTRFDLRWNEASQSVTGGTFRQAGTDWVAVNGSIIGGHRGGDSVFFSIEWSSGAPFGGGREDRGYVDNFTGKIAPDGSVTGTRLDNAKATWNWRADQRFTCTKRAPETTPDTGSSPVKPPPAKPKPVTNAITLTFAPPAIGSITATIANSSNLPGQCTYDATPDFNSHRDFTVPPKSETSLVINGFNTGITYHAVVVCKDASNTQTEPIGRAESDVVF